MRFLKVSAFLFLVGLSGVALGSPEAKNAALKYQKALDAKDKEELKSAVTKEYYAKLSKNNLIDRLFKTKKNEKSQNYQVKVVESKVVKGSVMASIESKSGEPKSGESKSKQKHKEKRHKTWVKLKKINGKYLVSGESHLD